MKKFLDRLWAMAKRSATIAWQYVVILGSLVLSLAGVLSDTLSTPEVRDWIQSWVTPGTVGTVTIVIALVTILARLRTLGD